MIGITIYSFLVLVHHGGPVTNGNLTQEMEDRHFPRREKWIKSSCLDQHDYMNCGAAIAFLLVLVRTDEPLPNAERGTGLSIPGLNSYDISIPCKGGMETLCYPKVWTRGAHTYPDLDWTCNWLGDEKWTFELEWSGQRAFKSGDDKEFSKEGGGGDSGRLTFATVEGTGHMVPYNGPKESLLMVQRTVVGEEGMVLSKADLRSTVAVYVWIRMRKVENETRYECIHMSLCCSDLLTLKHPQKHFILDLLAEAGEKMGIDHLNQFCEIKQDPSQSLTTAPGYGEDTTDYEAPAMSVKSRAEIVLMCVGKSVSPSTVGSRGDSKKSAKRPNVMREAIMMYAQPIVGLDLSIIGRLGNLERIKASHAYSKGEYFGFFVAFRELWAIKAEVSGRQGVDGGGAVSTRLLDEVRSISSSCRRLYQ
ncbi:hypothetical protein K435DRAFT_800362 [Dendrothele bispora CBS 962.96]|uniref:Uncharacterized protein n=1 Tax=Dendrothele bispora (strain CBS 962.96) TaxID=1314807 RepID=A0A4S8LTC1_DENBC|nr:hypothetical protein K435DRAFT_800362 [Dendrothele bispora CBS 962.96]